MLQKQMIDNESCDEKNTRYSSGLINGYEIYFYFCQSLQLEFVKLSYFDTVPRDTSSIGKGCPSFSPPGWCIVPLWAALLVLCLLQIKLFEIGDFEGFPVVPNLCCSAWSKSKS